MAVRRNVFRIEESAYHLARRSPSAAGPNGHRPEFRRLERSPDRRLAAGLEREFASIVADAERSANAILRAVEDIDRSAADLSACAGPGHARPLADDIRCHVGQILEACGFHDLTGQRIARVQAALADIEAECGRRLGSGRGIGAPEPDAVRRPSEGGGRLLNGPKVDGDGGHCSQDDIDAVFGRA